VENDVIDDISYGKNDCLDYMSATQAMGVKLINLTATELAFVGLT
jgi:hypothetical protein